MSLSKKLLLGGAILVALLVVVGLLLPARVHVERSTKVEAPPHVVFALVANFDNFNRWSPWAERDPDTIYTYEGPSTGVGARMSWASENPQVGSGSQEITAIEANRRVEARLDFGAQGTARSVFALEPTADGTEVTWGFDTDFGVDLVGRYMGLMFDSWIGADYEAGLENLEALAEALPSADWTDLEIEVLDLDPLVIVSTEGTTSWDVAEIGSKLASDYGAIGQFIRRHGLEATGQPLTITLGTSAEEWHFRAGVPVAPPPGLDLDPEGAVRIGETPGGRTARAISRGAYDNLRPNWEKLLAFAAVHGMEPRDHAWEQYISDPGSTAEADVITHLNLPVE